MRDLKYPVYRKLYNIINSNILYLKNNRKMTGLNFIIIIIIYYYYYSLLNV